MALLAPALFSLLYERGVSHGFGIPGDFALTLYDALQASPIQPVVVTHEPSAGFAADVYARIRGLGLAVITYSVGGINMANAVAGAYAERSPLVVLSGGPGVQERRDRPGLHHKIKTYTTQLNIFKEITAYAAVLDDPVRAALQIQEAVDVCLEQKRPVYLEIPRDQVYVDIGDFPRQRQKPPVRDAAVIKEAVAESVSLLNQSKQPVILVDLEVQRFGLLPQVHQLAEKLGAPVCTTLLGKSCFPENHPAFAGVYSGSVGDPAIRELVEGSDGLLLVGLMPTDINLGLFTARFPAHVTIDASAENVRIRHHTYPGVDFVSYITALSGCALERKYFSFQKQVAVEAEATDKITMRGVLEACHHFLDGNMILLGDAGDALFAMADMRLREATPVHHPAYYSSMGFAVPGALGAALADPSKRPVVLVGDGAFQMTGWELITAKKLGLRPIVIVLNNGTFGSLQSMGHRGAPFVEIARLDYSDIARSLGGCGFVVQTRSEMRNALEVARSETHFSVLDVRIEKTDVSPMLQRLGTLFASTLKG